MAQNFNYLRACRGELCASTSLYLLGARPAPKRTYCLGFRVLGFGFRNKLINLLPQQLKSRRSIVASSLALASTASLAVLKKNTILSYQLQCESRPAVNADRFPTSARQHLRQDETRTQRGGAVSQLCIIEKSLVS